LSTPGPTQSVHRRTASPTLPPTEPSAPARALVITDEASPFALRSTRNSFRGEQCAEARLHVERCRAAAQSPRAGVVTAEPSWIAQRRRPCNPSEVRAAQPAVAVVVAVQDVRTPARRSSLGPRPLSAMRTGVRPTGRADVWCPGDRCPGDRGDPGCPDGHASGVHSRCSRAVRTVLDPGIRRCSGTGPIGAPGWTCRCGRYAAWSSLAESGLAGRDGRTLAVRGSHEGRRQTWTATWYAYRLRRRARRSATRGVGPAPVPVGWRGSRAMSGCSKSPQMRPEQVGGVLADHGAGPEGGDHAAWSVRWCWSPVVPRWRPIRLSGE